MFLVEKLDVLIKGRTATNSSVQRSYILKEEASSYVVATESLLLSVVIDAKENHTIVTLDVLSTLA